MQLSRIRDELENLKSELWEYVEDGETDLQTDTKETMNYLLDLVDDLILCQEVQEKCRTNVPPTNIPEPPSKHLVKTVVNLSIDELRGLIKEVVANEFASHLFPVTVPYIPVQPYYCPNYYPTEPHCGKDITYTVDTKTTPKN